MRDIIAIGECAIGRFEGMQARHCATHEEQLSNELDA